MQVREDAIVADGTEGGAVLHLAQVAPGVQPNGVLTC